MTRASRRSRFLTVILSLCALLVAQVALASYACPGLAQVIEAQETAADAALIAADDADSSLCHGHCQAGQHTADHSPAPVFAPFEQLGELPSVPRAAGIETAAWARDWPRRDDGPPIAIRNCCFRI